MLVLYMKNKRHKTDQAGVNEDGSLLYWQNTTRQDKNPNSHRTEREEGGGFLAAENKSSS